MKWLCLLIILLCMPFSTAKESVTGSFTLENREPSVDLKIVKESLKIDVRDANGFEDIEYVEVIVNKSGEFSDLAVFEQGEGTDSVYYYDLRNFDDSEIEVIVSDGENTVNSMINYSKKKEDIPFITGFIVLNENIKGYFSRLKPYFRGFLSRIFG